MKGGSSAKALFTLQEDLRAIGVGGVGLTRKMERRLGSGGRPVQHRQKVGDPAKWDDDLICAASGSSAESHPLDTVKSTVQDRAVW